MRNDVKDPMLAYGHYLVPSPAPNGIYVVARPAGQAVTPMSPTMVAALGVGFGLVVGWMAANHLRSKK